MNNLKSFRLIWTAIRVGLVVLAADVCAGEKTKTIVSFPNQPVAIKTWLKQNKWESKRHNPRHFSVTNGMLKMASNRDSVMIGSQQGFPLSVREWPLLRMRLLVTANPAGTDLTKKRGDDAAFRVYFAFGKAKGILSPPVSLAYAWTENVPPGKTITSPHYSHVKLISIGHGTTGNKWVTIERDLVKDFQAAFPGRPLMPLTGVMLKCDSNNTKTTAEAWLKTIELIAAR